MGVSGCGKSVVGAGLAQRLELPYREGDDLHPAENVEKMRAGIALTDDDRWPWLDRVAQVLRTEAPVIVGCSALRRAYRDRIRAGAGDRVQFVHLAGAREVIAARLAARKHHFMPATLLDSQFATLESPGPDEALTVDVDQPLPLILDLIQAHLIGVTQ
jgi:gluconokinase